MTGQGYPVQFANLSRGRQRGSEGEAFDANLELKVRRNLMVGQRNERARAEAMEKKSRLMNIEDLADVESWPGFILTDVHNLVKCGSSSHPDSACRLWRQLDFRA